MTYQSPMKRGMSTLATGGMVGGAEAQAESNAPMPSATKSVRIMRPPS